jgi:hypothetical protein
VYFIKEGEFEVTRIHKVELDKFSPSKQEKKLLTKEELRVSIIGKN